jgi:hypothetical protein
MKHPELELDEDTIIPDRWQSHYLYIKGRLTSGPEELTEFEELICDHIRALRQLGQAERDIGMARGRLMQAFGTENIKPGTPLLEAVYWVIDNVPMDRDYFLADGTCIWPLKITRSGSAADYPKRKV